MSDVIRLGVLSDTHVPSRARVLPDEVFEAFEGVNAILHAGDLERHDMLDPLRVLAPVHAVFGNTDEWNTVHALPERLELEFGGVSVGLVHGHVGRGSTTPDRARSWFPTARVVVFGHSHQPLVEERGGQLLVNPGSPTDRRRAPTRTCAILTIEDGEPRAELTHF